MADDLKEKWRPKDFKGVYGNKQAINVLLDLLDRKEGPPPAIMFTGPRGCGKTTLAGCCREYLQVVEADWRELNTADDRGIETIRGLRNLINYAPSKKDGFRLIFLDECHKLTNDAQNALLKLIEKPPEHTRFLFGTTDPQLLLATFKSRCKIIEVSLMKDDDMFDLLAKIADTEDIPISDALLDRIVKNAQGVAREAIDILDTAKACKDDKTMQYAIDNYHAAEATTKELCQALLNRDNWDKVADILKRINDEPESVRYAIMGYMNAVLLNSLGDKKKNTRIRASVIIEGFTDSFMYSKKAGLTNACYMVLGVDQ